MKRIKHTEDGPVYHYTQCGLDNVMIVGIPEAVDDAGETVLTIPNVNGLHRAIALGIVSKRQSISGKELRFMRTEMGMTQAELAVMIHREPLAISRWERAEVPIDSNAETLIRLHAIQVLDLKVDASVKEISGWALPRAEEAQIRINGSDPSHYQLAA
jgi:transcriptional regulator with XRE-family HTH domain